MSHRVLGSFTTPSLILVVFAELCCFPLSRRDLEKMFGYRIPLSFS